MGGKRASRRQLGGRWDKGVLGKGWRQLVGGGSGVEQKGGYYLQQIPNSISFRS